MPDALLQKFFCYSRVPGAPKTYVQDRIREQSGAIAELVGSASTHIYICGLKGMEQGVDAALDDVCRGAGLAWRELRDTMRAAGRYHVETY